MTVENLRKYLRNPPLEVLQAAGKSDQRKGVEPPPIEKAIPEGAVRVDLVPPEALNLGSMPLVDAIRDRKSRRKFTEQALTLDELSFLLWATQGIREIHPKRVHAFRTVPSGGCRHPFETYLDVRRVEGVSPDLWRYSALEHALVLERETPGDESLSLSEACHNQPSVAAAAVTFVWTAIPYRTEWRYGPDLLKDILLSCGHICQNLYLACESIGAGTCAIVAYDQAKLDPYLGVDGVNEISLYVAPVGKI